MQLDKVLTSSLLFDKSVQKTKDTATFVTTYSAFGSRPTVYTSPGPLPTLAFPKGRLKLAVHGHSSSGDAREVISGALEERLDGAVLIASSRPDPVLLRH